MATAETPLAAAPEERRGGVLWVGRLAWAAVGAVVALLASVTPVLEWVAPDLKADPQVQLEGSVRIVTLERGVTYGGYLLRTGQESRRTATPAHQQEAQGVLVYVGVQTKGLKRRWGRLSWYGYDPATRHRLSPENDPSRGSQFIRGGTSSDRLIVPVWAQVPTSGRYFLRFELRARGVLLSVVDSKTFRNCARVACGTP